MRKKIIFPVLFFTIIIFSVKVCGKENKHSYILMPAVIHLEGIGTPFGIFAGVQNISKHKFGVLAGKTFGPIEGYGGALSVRPFSSYLDFLIGKIDISNAQYKTTYLRGLGADDPVIQEVGVDFQFAQARLNFWKDRIKFAFLMGKYVVELKKYLTVGEEEIFLTDANLFDIDSKLSSISLFLDLTRDNNYLKQGISFDFRTTTQSGRFGLSDTRINSYGLTLYQPLWNNFLFAMRLQRSDSSVRKKLTEYDTKAENVNALGGDCTENTDPAIRALCERLKHQLAEQITAENNLGTAQPIGGSYSLRGYREFRYKAAHTSFVSTELRWNLSQSLKVPFFNRKDRLLQTLCFFELGFANDQSSQLYKKSVESKGLEVIAYFKKTSLRLGLAKGRETSAWYFTAGKNF